MTEHLELAPLDRVRYFAPTAICVYLAVICTVLIIVSAFLVTIQNAVAVTAAGIFGLTMTGGLGIVFWKAQRRDLQFTRVITDFDAASNFEAVLCAARHAGWRIVRQEAASRLDAASSTSLLDAGERITVLFRGGDVLVASICDPSIGFSLVGRRHCAAHRDLVLQAVGGRGA